MAFATKVHKMGVAALLLGVSVFISRFMGLVRDKVISWHFGASADADIYFTSFVIPDFINYLLAGGYFSITLIPLLATCFSKDEDNGWRFFSAAFWWIGLTITVITGIAWWQAPALAILAAPGFSPEALAHLAYFLRIILPAQIWFLMGACLSALLYQRRQFTIPAISPLVYNACIIAGGLLMLDKGMEGFCWGVLVGALLGSFLLPLWAVHSGGLSLRLTMRHAYVKRFILLALPLMIGQSVVVLDEQFVRIFGSLTGEGSVSLLNYARRIMLVPVGVVAQAAGLASYPFLAALAAKGLEGRKDFDATLSSALQSTLVIIIPLAAWMIVAAEPTLRLIFEGGDFGATQTAQAVPLLQVMLCGVALWAVQQVVGRAFYAQQDTIRPALIGTVATLLSLPLYAIWAKDFGAVGVALAGLGAVFLYTVFLLAVWVKRYGGGALVGIVPVLAASFALSVPAGLCAWWPAVHFPYWATAMLADHYTLHPLLGALGALGLSFFVFVLIYVPLVWRFMPEMIRPVASRLVSKIKKR